MSYYKYLKSYHPRFLRMYQTDTYTALARSSRYADIVHMNSTSTLSIDEDLSLNLSVPLNITNFLGFMSLVYWYFYHVEMYAANTFKKRLRSYFNYKMWSRLEIAVYKSNVQEGKVYTDKMIKSWLKKKNLTAVQLEELRERLQNGESLTDVLASWGLKLDAEKDRLVQE